MPENTFPLPCVIFAGGKSSRMGRNKALLPFDGFDTLAAYQYARLSPLFASAVLSVKTTKGYPEGLPYLPDDPSLADAAPTAGFITAFRSLDAERIFALSVDTPFVDGTVIRALLARDSRELDAVIARTARGTHPLCGIYHRSLLARFEAMAASGDHKLGRMLSESRVRYVDFDDEQLFSNLNHPHEYEAALKTLDKK
ncbi:molybdenum cofactor guanylyltransferase MobA [Sulfurimonas diazotrophicus]|uniref:Probable molybdenum cofactor guanylyltransferase n=1 Tax=Sulfurimonas diazotrophicus TaxID=3131939 RepID=A0ABZ3HBF9_9BACT